jgi:hypothetical protein
MLRKMLQTAGLCLASVLVMGMGLAGNASAALLWLVCLPGEGLTRYTTSRCLTAGGTGNPRWESRGLLAGEEPTVRILVSTILLRDTKALGGESEIQCYNEPGNEGEVVIGKEGKGKITKAKLKEPKTECKRIKGACTGITKIQAINLPWNTSIFEGPNGNPLTKIESSGAGAPGWEVECETILGKRTDACEEESGKPEEVELFSEVTPSNPGTGKELLVRARFEDKNPAKCSQGGAEAGHVSGLVAILLPGGAVSIRHD